MLNDIEDIMIGATNTSVADIVPYRLVDISSVTGEFEMAIGTSGGVNVGIIMDACVIGDKQAVLMSGIGKVLASGTVTAGEHVECAAGLVLTSTTPASYIGVALSTGTDVLVDVWLK